MAKIDGRGKLTAIESLVFKLKEKFEGFVKFCDNSEVLSEIIPKNNIKVSLMACFNNSPIYIIIFVLFLFSNYLVFNSIHFS
jgi:hypothetical protein